MQTKNKYAGVALIIAAIVVFVAVFQWNWLRGPINNYVSEKTGRQFVIAGDINVGLGRTLKITLHDVQFDNAEWAQAPLMAKAETVFLSVRLLPLLRGHMTLAELGLVGADASLERSLDGKRNWTLAKSDDMSAEPPDIEQISLRKSNIHYIDAPYAIDLKAAVSTDDDTASAFPTHIEFSGIYKKAAIKGTALAGPVLTLADTDASFPAKIEARFGPTTAKLDGTLSNLNRGGTIDAELAISGSDLSKLYPVLPLVLPSTAPFRIKGHLTRNADNYRYENFEGVIGQSDIRGSATYSQAEPRPMLKATLDSRVLDLADLGPLIGMTPAQLTAAKAPAKSKAEKAVADRSGPPRKVLPNKPFNLSRMNAMDADVTLNAKRIRRPNEIPLDDMRTHIVLNAGELTLDPLEFAFSGGKIAAKIKIDGRQTPFQASTEINLRNVKLQELFPTFDLMRASFGTIGAQIKLTGSGNSVATMLGNATGEAGFAMAGGEWSGLLLEAVDLNGAGIVKYLAFGDKSLPNRCSVAIFDIKDGLATSRTMVFDTSISNIQGSGTLNLKGETVDLKLEPRPKKKSVFVARTPILLHGPFSRLDYELQKGPLLSRGGAALVLGAINPLATILALLETGPGKDANCQELLAQAEGAQSQAHRSAAPAVLPKPVQTESQPSITP